MNLFQAVGLLILLCICPKPSLAQSTVEDSLLQLIPNQVDTNKVWTYRDLAKEFVFSEPEKAMSYAQQGIDLAQQIDFLRGEAFCTYLFGLGQDMNGQQEDAIQTFIRAKEQFQKIGDAFYEGNCLVNMGTSYYYSGSFDKALEYYLKALEFYESKNMEKASSKALNNMAIIYKLYGDYNEALRIYKKSLKIKSEQGDSLGMANTYYNMALAYARTENEEATLEHFQRAGDLYQQLNKPKEIGEINVGLGQAYFALDSLSLAKSYFQTAFQPDAPPLQPLTRIQGYLYLGRIYLLEKNFQEALEYMEAGYEPIKDSDRHALIKDFQLYLGQAYAGAGDYQKGYEMLLQNSDLVDTIQQETRLKLLEEMQTKYDTQEKENQIELQQLEIEKKNREQKLFIALLAAALVLIVSASWFLIERQRSNRKLKEKNDLIARSLKEKETLLKEIHHRVKNNLQVISSLLRLQSRHIEDPSALSAIQEGQNRVKSMALIHQNLYQEDNLMGVDVKDYITKLSGNLLRTYNVNPEKIQLKTDIETLHLDVDTLIPLGLILNELISNSLKYAFEESEDGQIQVKLKEKDQRLMLEVKDNGIGIPEELKSGRASSFGLKLIQTFAQKLNAQLLIENQEGTVVRLLIKDYKLAG